MVVDTMVLAYALLKVKGKYEESTLVLKMAERIIVPDSARAELANVCWQWVRAKSVPQSFAYSALQDAESLFD